MASAWPSEIRGDAVAAFVPQMYSRMVQYSNELKLGEPSHFTLMFENVPLQIFKSGQMFLTVLGRSGEELPKTELKAVLKGLQLNSPIAR